MPGFIICAAVGALCIIIGISNMKGNISSIHSYHRHRVAEEDALPFGRLVGLGTVIVGASVIVFSILATVTVITNGQAWLLIGIPILFIGIAVGLVISFYAMKKYNHGIF